MKTRCGLVSFGALKQAKRVLTHYITVKSVAQMVTLKNDDQGFASSNHTGTNFFINQKLNLASFCLFVCLI